MTILSCISIDKCKVQRVCVICNCYITIGSQCIRLFGGADDGRRERKYAVYEHRSCCNANFTALADYTKEQRKFKRRKPITF
jgi:hypothetical protein